MILKLGHGSPTRGPSGCIMRHAATFAHYVYAINISQEFKWLGIPLAVIFPRAAREPAALTGVVLCRKKVSDPRFRVSINFG